jgi:hypothetical protein
LTSPAIYRIDGVKVANSGAVLWGGQIDARIELSERGNEVFAPVYTGTTPTGQAANPGFTSGPLGGSMTGAVTTGHTGVTNSQWVADSSFGASTVWPFYGISSVLTVPQPAAIPEPASVALVLVGVIGLAGSVRARWRSRAASLQGEPRQATWQLSKKRVENSYRTNRPSVHVDGGPIRPTKLDGRAGSGDPGCPSTPGD